MQDTASGMNVLNHKRGTLHLISISQIMKYNIQYTTLRAAAAAIQHKILTEKVLYMRT